MPKDVALGQLRHLADISGGDPEACHVEADRVLCQFLIGLGHADIVAEWERVDKWYA